MATRNAVAIMTLNATNRMLDAVEALEGKDSRTAIEQTQHESRDPAYRDARKLEEIAGVLERQVQSIRASAETDLNRLDGVGDDLAGNLRAAGFPTVSDLDAASDADLLAVDGIGARKLKALRQELDALGADPPVAEDVPPSETPAETPEQPVEGPVEEGGEDGGSESGTA